VLSNGPCAGFFVCHQALNFTLLLADCCDRNHTQYERNRMFGHFVRCLGDIPVARSYHP